MTLTSDIEIEAVPTARATAGWLTSEAVGELSPHGKEVLLLKLGSRLMGRRSSLDLWLDPATAAAFQRTQLETGQRIRHNRYRALRFADGGVLSTTARPADDEIGKPHTEWSLVSGDFREYPLLDGGELAVTEPSALFYVLSTSELERPGDRVTTHVYSKNRLLRVELIVEESTQIEVDYMEATPRSERQVRSRRDALRILIRSQPLDGRPEAGGFELLGLRGDVYVFLDPHLRLPLQISGDIRYAGRGNVRLRRAVLR